MDCIFCKIVNNELKVKKIFENNLILSFKDISPQAPSHILVIPKKHVVSISDIEDNEISLVTDLFSSIKKIIDERNISHNGYRLIVNSGYDGGQTVNHLHFHILSGRKMLWPPG